MSTQRNQDIIVPVQSAFLLFELCIFDTEVQHESAAGRKTVEPVLSQNHMTQLGRYFWDTSEAPKSFNL